MGYRSQVYLGVNDTAMKSLLDMCALQPEAFELLFEYHKPQKTKHGVFWDLDYFKWYESYPCVGAIEGWMGDLDIEDRDDEYGFYRMGEEFGDTEEQGSSEHFCFYPCQHVEIEFEAAEDEKVEA
jgi:hypothetical protein